MNEHEVNQPAADHEPAEGIPPSLKVVPTVFPASPPIEECIDRFWRVGPAFETGMDAASTPRSQPSVLEQLGPSPFPRGGFPVVGFLATTYERVSAFAKGAITEAERPDSLRVSGPLPRPSG